jgi:hypothetical protein
MKISGKQLWFIIEQKCGKGFKDSWLIDNRNPNMYFSNTKDIAKP